MSRIRSRNTKPELRVRQALYKKGLRYQLHPKDLPGRPDLTFRSRSIALFVHGCFWHRHPGCRNTRTPKTRVAFWAAKFAENIARDEAVGARLVSLGWVKMIIWECETYDAERLELLAMEIRKVPAKIRR